MPEDHHHTRDDQVQGNLAVGNEAFLRGVFGDAWPNALVTAFHHDPSGSSLPPHVWAASRAGARLHTFREDENAYYCVSLFTPEYEVGGRTRVRRTKARFESQHLVVVDDVFSKVDAAMIRARMGEPSFCLTTSPGNQQWGYIFEHPIRLREAAEQLIAAMINAGITADGKDPGMSAVTRYVRLPVGRNTKAALGPSGFATRLETWLPERRFDAVLLARVWGVDLHEVLRQTRARAAEAQQAAPQREVVVYQAGWGNAFRAADHPHAASFAPEDMEGDDDELRGTPDDPLWLGLRALVLARGWRSGVEAIHCTCPFVSTHTGRADNGTAFMVRRGSIGGGINCFHGHCVGRGRGEYKIEVARRLRARGAHGDEALAERLQPRQSRKKHVAPLDPDTWAGIARLCRRFERNKNAETFDEKRSLYGLAVSVARYVIAARVTDAEAAAAVERVLTAHGVSAAAWRLAWAWGMGKAREEGTDMA